MSQTTINDREMLSALHAFGREWIGVGCGDEDVWAALHQVMPEPWRLGFMFMGVIAQGALRIFDYKHGITRRCLSLDNSGRVYRYDPGTQNYVPQTDATAAIEGVFEDIERLGATRETPYDEAYRQRRDDCLADAGYRVLSVSDRGVSAR